MIAIGPIGVHVRHMARGSMRVGRCSGPPSPRRAHGGVKLIVQKYTCCVLRRFGGYRRKSNFKLRNNPSLEKSFLAFPQVLYDENPTVCRPAVTGILLVTVRVPAPGSVKWAGTGVLRHAGPTHRRFNARMTGGSSGPPPDRTLWPAVLALNPSSADLSATQAPRSAERQFPATIAVSILITNS